MHSVMAFPSFAAWMALAALAGSAAPLVETRPDPSYVNPVIDADFPDPAVLKVPDGYYYAYATQSGSEGAMRNIQVARSTDLVRWEMLPDALPAKPAWASRTQDFWAPHVVEDRGRYYLYYSARPDAALTDASRGLCLGVATADRPFGPFRDSGRALQCGPGFVNIDPMAFDDPATGKHLLYWGSGFGPIKVRELARDRLAFAPGSAALDLIVPIKSDKASHYQRLVEGAWVLRRGGWYYLFYSGDNCCGPQAHYAVMVARSRSASGPFERLPPGPGSQSGVILHARQAWLAPGHNSIIEDACGTDWIVYHAVDSRRPRARPTDAVNTRRVALIDRIEWRRGWPRIDHDGPSAGPRPRPCVARARTR
jgi:arabinan endo-1,5-alpha-L-arabinosidase